MQKRPLGLTVFLWCEMIIAVRILLFTIPVLINKNLNKSFSMADISDWFLVGISFVAAFYAVTGLVSLLGFKLWKVFHYVACVLTLFLTASLMKYTASTGPSLSMGYFVPMVISVLIILYIASVKLKTA